MYVSVLPKEPGKNDSRLTIILKLIIQSYIAPDYGYDGLKYVKAKDNFDRSKMPGSGPNPVVKVPAFWKKDLANGIKSDWYREYRIANCYLVY